MVKIVSAEPPAEDDNVAASARITKGAFAWTVGFTSCTNGLSLVYRIDRNDNGRWDEGVEAVYAFDIPPSPYLYPPDAVVHASNPGRPAHCADFGDGFDLGVRVQGFTTCETGNADLFGTVVGPRGASGGVAFARLLPTDLTFSLFFAGVLAEGEPATLPLRAGAPGANPSAPTSRTWCYPIDTAHGAVDTAIDYQAPSTTPGCGAK